MIIASSNIPAWLQAVEQPSQSHGPAWLAASRKEHWQTFIQQGLPTPKQERWKYTDLSFLNHAKELVPEKNCLTKEQINSYRLANESILLVLENGYFAPHLSDIAQLPSSMIVSDMQTALTQHEALVKRYMFEIPDLYLFAKLNTALFNDGLFIFVPDNCILEKPLHLLSITTGDQAFFSQPRHLVVVRKNCQLTWLEEYVATSTAAYFTNQVTQIHVGENSQLQQIKIQREAASASHLATTTVYQQADSRVSMTHFSLGAHFSRDDVIVELQAPNASCQTAAFYRLANDNQYVDHHVEIHHRSPHTHSEMLYKGVIDKKARAVFNGRLHVAQEAKKIVAHQQNHTLLLSNQAESYSKPELEIYADDVKCKHGATTGQLDQDALFYLQARGIQKAEAVSMLLQAFAAEIVQQISHSDIRAHVEEVVQCL